MPHYEDFVYFKTAKGTYIVRYADGSTNVGLFICQNDLYMHYVGNEIYFFRQVLGSSTLISEPRMQAVSANADILVMWHWP